MHTDPMRTIEYDGPALIIRSHQPEQTGTVVTGIYEGNEVLATVGIPWNPIDGAMHVYRAEFFEL